MTFDETIAQLDHLLQIDRTKRERALSQLQSIVQRLDAGSSPDVVEPLVERSERRQARGVTNPGTPFVPLPSRTTHGGPWGPAMRAKLRAQALGR
jgi:hypothetical protein